MCAPLCVFRVETEVLQKIHNTSQPHQLQLHCHRPGKQESILVSLLLFGFEAHTHRAEATSDPFATSVNAVSDRQRVGVQFV